MDKLEQMKLVLEKEVIPGFVHRVEEKVGDAKSGIMEEIRHYLGAYGKDHS